MVETSDQYHWRMRSHTMVVGFPWKRVLRGLETYGQVLSLPDPCTIVTWGGLERVFWGRGHSWDFLDKSVSQTPKLLFHNQGAETFWATLLVRESAGL